MNYKILIIVVLVFFSNCKENIEPAFEEVEVLEVCVEEEEIVLETSGFIMFEQGEQLDGFSRGIKINEEWNASAFLAINDSTYEVVLTTYWLDTIDNLVYLSLIHI